MAEQESILRIKIDSRNAEKNANSLNKELQSIEKNGDFASKSMDSMSVATRQLAGYMAGIVTVGAAINKMDLYTNLNNRLKLVTTNQTELNTALNDTFAIAQKSYQAWDSVVQVYQRFSDNAKTLGINMQQTAQLTETVSKAVAISGASTQAAEAALTQFGQALASGTLRGEELNSILEQTPALAKAIAQGMGITVGQLRSVAAEGKITGDVLVKALTKSKQSVDELFSRTDITIGQSITLLSNEVTKFTGEAGKASSAASFMAEAIKTLSQNLDLIANIAIVGGVALLTKAIATQTATLYASIGATIKKREADAAAIQSQIQLAGLELQRTRQVQALALTEINLARQELNSATTRQARAAATMRLTQAEIAHNIAIKQTAASVTALNVVESQLNKTRSLGAAALGLVGGPIGAITLGVTALSAGYMYMSSRTAEANAKLEEQAKVANKTAAELKNLEGAQLAAAKNDLAESFKAQNEELARLDRLIGNSIAQISSRNTADAETAKILRDVRAGVMSYDDALKVLNKTHANSPNTIAELKSLINEYETLRPSVQKNADAQATLGTKVKIAGNEAQNAVGKINDNTGAMRDNESAANGAANAQSKFIDSLKKTALQTDITNRLIAKGWDIDKAKLTANALIENNNKLSGSDMLVIDRKLAADKKLKASEDAIANAQRARTSASKSALTQGRKDAKDAERLAEEQYNMRESIAYNYADRLKKIEIDLQRNISDIQKANFSPKDTAGLIEVAKNRSKLEKDLYVAQLAEEYSAWGLSEERKLELRKNVNDIALSLNGDLTDDMKAQAQQSLDDQYAYELANIKLAKEQRIFQAEQAFMSETDMIRKKYELERQEISKMQDKKEAAALQEAKNKEFINLNTRLGGDMLSSVSRISDNFGMNQEQTLNAEYIKQNEEMNLRYAQQVEAAKQNAAELLIIEQDFLEAKDRLNTEYAEKITTARQSDYENQLQYYGNMLSTVQSTFGNMTSMVKESQGETSSAYKAMFLAQQAMAVASALVSTHLAAAQVMADPTALTLAQKTTYANLIMGMGYANVGMIIGQTIAGFKTGGYTGNGGVSDVAGVVHGKEFVLNAEATKRVGVGTLNAINNGASVGGGITVNIVNNGTPQAYDVQQIDENTVKIIATDIVNKEVTRQLGAPNSPISKGIKQNFNTSNRRG